jgi:hypothetical protein
MVKTKIVILGVLHSFHSQVPSYSLEHLKSALEKIKPDVLCAELKQSEIDSDKKQNYKIEYGVILPYTKNHNVKVVGLDPEEPLLSKMVDPYVKNQKEFPKRSPVESKVQDIYQAQLFDYLIKEHWVSIDKTQSAITNTLFQLKHRFQEELMGPEEKNGWDKFNEYYANIISTEAKKNPGKTVLVTIGLEHVYWLKEKLGKDSALTLVDTESLLK